MFKRLQLVSALTHLHNPKERGSIDLLLNILNLVQEVPTVVKHINILSVTCLKKNPSTFIKLCHACEILESNAADWQIGGSVFYPCEEHAYMLYERISNP